MLIKLQNSVWSYTSIPISPDSLMLNEGWRVGGSGVVGGEKFCNRVDDVGRKQEGKNKRCEMQYV